MAGSGTEFHPLRPCFPRWPSHWRLRLPEQEPGPAAAPVPALCYYPGPGWPAPLEKPHRLPGGRLRQKGAGLDKPPGKEGQYDSSRVSVIFPPLGFAHQLREMGDPPTSLTALSSAGWRPEGPGRTCTVRSCQVGEGLPGLYPALPAPTRRCSPGILPLPRLWASLGSCSSPWHGSRADSALAAPPGASGPPASAPSPHTRGAEIPSSRAEAPSRNLTVCF